MIKVQVFVNGAYAYRKTLKNDELDQTHLLALLQQILHTIEPSRRYSVDLTLTKEEP